MRPWLDCAEPAVFPPAVRLVQAGGWAGARFTPWDGLPGLASNQNSRGYRAAARRPLRDPEALAQRLADWADEARLSGRMDRADALMLLAWKAYDAPRTVAHRPLPAPVPAAAKRPALVLLLAS